MDASDTPSPPAALESASVSELTATIIAGFTSTRLALGEMASQKEAEKKSNARPKESGKTHWEAHKQRYAVNEKYREKYDARMAKILLRNKEVRKTRSKSRSERHKERYAVNRKYREQYDAKMERKLKREQELRARIQEKEVVYEQCRQRLRENPTYKAFNAEKSMIKFVAEMPVRTRKYRIDEDFMERVRRVRRWRAGRKLKLQSKVPPAESSTALSTKTAGAMILPPLKMSIAFVLE
jgi:hypothetical protein